VSSSGQTSCSISQYARALLPVEGVFVVPIRPYLDGHSFDPETVRLLGLAFEITRAALKTEDEPVKQAIAIKLIEFAKQGERDPERLSDRALALIRNPG
jgi:hypothetical protein